MIITHISHFLDSFLWFLLISVSQISLTLERYLIVDSRIHSRELNTLLLDINLDFHSFPILCLDSLLEDPWRLFVNSPYRRCHRRALLESVLIIRVHSRSVESPFISLILSVTLFYFLNLLVVNLSFLSLHSTSISCYLLLCYLPITSTLIPSILSIIAVYFWTAKQAYGQWMVYGEFSHSKIRTHAAAGIRILRRLDLLMILSVDFPIFIMICSYCKIILIFPLSFFLGPMSLSLLILSLTSLILRRIIHNCSELLCDSYGF
jgi:hypothetical protein